MKDPREWLATRPVPVLPCKCGGRNVRYDSRDWIARCPDCNEALPMAQQTAEAQ